MLSQATHLNPSEALKRCFYFSSLSPEQSLGLANICSITSYDTGEMVFMEGEEAKAFYIVISGQVQIYKISREGKEMILHVFGPGEIFAEVPIFGGMATYPANVMCMKSSQILSIEGEGFKALVHQYPEIAIKMLNLFAKRLRAFNVLIEDLSLRSVDSRLAKFLLSVSESTPDKAMIRFHKKTLASILGTIPETLSRYLKKLADEGMIIVKGQEIEILDRKALQYLADLGQ